MNTQKIRERLGLRVGDRLGDRLEFRAPAPPAGQNPVSVEEMYEAIRRHVRKKYEEAVRR